MGTELMLEIKTEASNYGIEENKAINLIGNLPQIKEERDVLSAQYQEITKMDIENAETWKLAKELRIKIKNNRTKGILTWHSTTKEYFLKGGQFVDAIKRKEEAINVRMEEALEQIEKYEEIKIAREREELRQKRQAEVEGYTEYMPKLDLSLMPESDYQNMLEGAKLLKQAAIEKEKKEAEERLEREKLQKLRAEKINMLLPYSYWIDNYKELDFDNIGMDRVMELIADAEKKKQKEKEALELAKNALQAQQLLEEQKKKAEFELAKKQAELIKERDKKEKIERELKEKKEAQKELTAVKPNNGSLTAVMWFYQEVHKFINGKTKMTGNEIYEAALSMEISQTKPLVEALEDITNWDDDLEDEWEDAGHRAQEALNHYYKTFNK
jgi:hypothetical protein